MVGSQEFDIDLAKLAIALLIFGRIRQGVIVGAIHNRRRERLIETIALVKSHATRLLGDLSHGPVFRGDLPRKLPRRAGGNGSALGADRARSGGKMSHASHIRVVQLKRICERGVNWISDE